MSYPDIIVSGAGTNLANGIYVYEYMEYGKPKYDKIGAYGDGKLCWESWDNRWVIRNYEYGYFYYSTDDVPTPDLCTTWQVGGSGSPPVPTVTSAAPPPSAAKPTKPIRQLSGSIGQLGC